MTDTWRFIDSGICGAAYNMAIDEAIAVSVRKEIMPPTLRIYGWDTLAVSIGYFQKSGEIDVEYCSGKNIPIVRRATGGRAILHGEGVTYSFSVKTISGPFSKGLIDSYKKISTALISSLSKIGLSAEIAMNRKNPRSLQAIDRKINPLCFNSVSYCEITVNDTKIIGSAQKRWTDGLLQQGTIPFSVDKKETIRIFGIDNTPDLSRSLIGLRDLFPAIKTDKVKNSIRNSFEEIFNIKLILSYPSEQEIELARELEVRKYMSDEWNFRR
ncbi:MAG: lipoate--protein ligase family protein [Nitrospirae bacterium]|nr:lipoate--protein ligase family protein [Nitrospirota bacterium]